MNELEPLDPPRRPAHLRRRGRWRARLGRIEWYLDKIVQVEEAIERVLGVAKFNAAGLAALMSRAAGFREDLERIRRAIPDELEGADRAEIRDRLELQLEDWPDEHLEVSFLVYGRRHHGRILFVSESGHRAEYDPDLGWESSGADE